MSTTCLKVAASYIGLVIRCVWRGPWIQKEASRPCLQPCRPSNDTKLCPAPRTRRRLKVSNNLKQMFQVGWNDWPTFLKSRTCKYYDYTSISLPSFLPSCVSSYVFIILLPIVIHFPVYLLYWIRFIHTFIHIYTYICVCFV